MRTALLITFGVVRLALPQPLAPGAVRVEGASGAGSGAIDHMGRKPSVEAPLQWVDDSGEPIAVNQGAVWVEVVPIGTQVSAITKPRVSLDKGPTYPSG